jgi:hypothetical protein
MLVAWAVVVMHLLWAEAPRGSVSGTILMAERGTPLAGAKLRLISTSDRALVYRGKTDAAGRFAFHHIRAGVYRVVTDARAHKQPPEKIAVPEGGPVAVAFELQPTGPFLDLHIAQRVFSPGEDAAFRCDGFVPTDKLSLSAFKLTPAAAIAAYNNQLSAALTTRGRSVDQADLASIPELSLAKTAAADVRRRDAEGVFRQDLNLGKLPPGMYLVAAEAAGHRALGVLTVTDLGLIFKAGRRNALAFAVDIKTGLQRAGVSLELLAGGKTIWQGATSSDGLAAFDLPADLPGGDLRLVGRSGESMAVASSYRGESEAGPLRVYTYTDRPIYRPGQRVSFKSLIRELQGPAYKVPSRLDASVRVTDEKQNILYAASRSTNAFGSFHGGFDLPAAAVPGIYTLSVLVAGKTHEANFAVAEYRKPEFEVTVKPSADRVIRGDRLDAVLQAEYFYGAPVPDAVVEYRVLRSPYWFVPADEAFDEDLFEPEYAEGEIVLSARGRTDHQGRLAISVPTAAEPKKKHGPAALDIDEDARLVLDVSVTDASRREATGSADVVVVQGQYRLDVSADDSVAEPGQKVAVTIKAADYDGRPIASARGELVLARSRWEGDREILDEESRVSWQADQTGEAHATVVPKSDGEYRLAVKSTDAAGHVIASSSYVWVMRGTGGTFAFPYQDLDMRADRKLYRPGDTAQIVVNTRHAPAVALLTLEGVDILDRRLVRLDSKSTVLNLPVRAEYLPAVTANLCFVKGKKFFSGHAILNVSRENKTLRLDVAADKQSYAPGERASYRVRATAPDGKPVQAEVSLGVVDEAIYALSPDTTEDIARFFYPKRLLEVDTVFSFPEVYLSGDDKAHGEIRTRRFFPDTAFWQPAAVTDARGEATFSFAMPDNLTTWRATCRAATLDTLVGQTTQKVIVTKPFLVRLEAPRFFTQGDQVSIAALLHNLTSAPVNASIGLEAPSLKLSGSANTSASVGQGDTKRIEWTVTAPSVGDARLRVWAKAGQLSDAMELTIPVLAKGRERTVTQAGVATASRDLRFDVRADTIPGTQGLTLRLTPSLAGAMLGALDYLAAYPYGCVEQTMSAFLPDVVIAQVLRAQQFSSPRLEKELPAMVQAGLLKLSDMQHDDGGFGWWKFDKTDVWMTAYVVFGLAQARAAGFQVNDNLLTRAAAALEKLSAESQPKKQNDEDARVYGAYVLALVGRGAPAANLIAAYSGPAAARRSRLTDQGAATLASALALLGRADEARSVLADVWSRFAAGHLRAGEQYVGPSDLEIAAAMLSASCDLMPQDPRLPDLVRWTLTHRQGNHWISTRDTAFVLYALSKYLALTRELKPNLAATVTINGKPVARRVFTGADVFQPEFEVTVPAADLGQGAVSIKLDISGEGRLYYTAALRQVVAEDLTVPVKAASGITIERAYRKVTIGEMPPASEREDSPEPKSAPAGPPTTTFSAGDIIDVTLTLRCAADVEDIMLEDPLPAGCEAQDRGRIDPWEWDCWWADQIVRDQKVAFAITSLKTGAHQIRYQMRVQTPGIFTALPPTAYDMYNPALRSDGIAQTLTLRP